MYAPAHFREDRIAVLHQAITALSFGTLVTAGSQGLEASHLPMLIALAPAPLGTLRGHVARANPQWKNAPAGCKALATFVGPDAYITPSWYATKAQTGKVVPTWNYLAVQVHGEISFFDDRTKLRAIVEDLTEFHEGQRPAPWAVSDAPEDYIEKMLNAIIGLELTIAQLEGSWKLSQNRTAQDSHGVREGLLRDGSPSQRAVADLMTATTKGKD